MAFSFQPSVVSNGLVLCLDGGNILSYPRTGTVWTDLKTSITGSLTNGPTFSSANLSSTNLGSIAFDGTNDYVNFGNTDIGIDLSDKTISCWIYKTADGDYGLVDKDYDLGPGNYGGWGLWIQSNNKLWWWNTKDKDLKDTGSTTVQNNVWTHCTATYDYTNKTARFYINGSLNSTITNATIAEVSSAGANFVLGATRVSTTFATTGQFFFPGRISVVHIYKRMLTGAEVLQNYNALKRRFNIV